LAVVIKSMAIIGNLSFILILLVINI